MDNAEIYVKTLLASLLAAVSMRVQVIGQLLWLFIAAALLDYITGVFAAAYNKQLSSEIGGRGIIKKAGTCCIIAVALLADEIVLQAGSGLGVTISTGGTIATIVTTWLVLNELISILENISKLNVALPSFLTSAIKLLKKQNEAGGERLTDSENADNDEKPPGS